MSTSRSKSLPSRSFVAAHLTRLQARYVLCIALCLLVALASAGRGSMGMIVAIAVVVVTFLGLMWIAVRHAHRSGFWAAVQFGILLSGLISVLAGLVDFADKQYVEKTTNFVNSEREAFVWFIEAGERIELLCTGHTAQPGNDPKDACARLGELIWQARNESNNPRMLEVANVNRWDLEFCGSEVPTGVEMGQWVSLCESAKRLNESQQEVIRHNAERPHGVLYASFQGKPLLFWLIVTGVLFAAQCVKFVYDLGTSTAEQR
jgi:hypothetical protein